MSSSNIISVGAVNNPDADVVRIVHISDTHLQHNKFIENKNIPDGDILVHSGDFAKFDFSRLCSREEDYINEITELNKFFASLPHRYKIFVSGNHETNFLRESIERTSCLLTNGIYLQDSWVTIEGIKFYGSPWNGIRHNSFARGFGILYSSLPDYWKLIPNDTDILITHNPPFGIRDLGLNKHFLNVAVYCDICKEDHKEYLHFGCPALRDEVLHRVRPKAHLFGHAHEPNGILWQDGVLFSNAAMACTPNATVLDYHVEAGKEGVTNIVPQLQASDTRTCSIM